MQLEEKKSNHERTLEHLGELLASIHNNGHPYDGKKAMQRKDFIRLSYDEDDQDETPDMEAIQETMRLANEALNNTMNHEN